MRYTVTWIPSARNELADIWVNATDKRAVTAAANEIDRLLGSDAHLQGEEFGEVRILEEWPLVVTFRVSPDDRLAEVTDVRHL